MSTSDTVQLTVVQSSADVGLDDYTDRLGADVRVVRAFDGEQVPAADDLGDGLVVLGGHMSAYDDETAPWLPATRALLLAAVERDVPTLGICLGAQLLAVAAGGSVQVAAPPGREAGLVRVYWRDAAAADDVLGPLVRDAGGWSWSVSMHADAVVDLPAGAAWLGSSVVYPYQAFRLGSALGVQFHPEATPATIGTWASRYDDVDTAAVLADVDAHADAVAGTGRRLAAEFVRTVRESAARRAAGRGAAEPVGAR